MLSYLALLMSERSH